MWHSVASSLGPGFETGVMALCVWEKASCLYTKWLPNLKVHSSQQDTGETVRLTPLLRVITKMPLSHISLKKLCVPNSPTEDSHSIHRAGHPHPLQQLSLAINLDAKVCHHCCAFASSFARLAPFQHHLDVLFYRAGPCWTTLLDYHSNLESFLCVSQGQRQ